MGRAVCRPPQTRRELYNTSIRTSTCPVRVQTSHDPRESTPGLGSYWPGENHVDVFRRKDGAREQQQICSDLIFVFHRALYACSSASNIPAVDSISSMANMILSLLYVRNSPSSASIAASSVVIAITRAYKYRKKHTRAKMLFGLPLVRVLGQGALRIHEIFET